MQYLLDQPVRLIPPSRPINRIQILTQPDNYNLKLLNIPLAWAESKGENVKVVVLDTGLPKHRDMLPTGSASFIPGYLVDLEGHGTHVGGIIAALENGIGITGIAPNCEDYYGAVLGKDGSGTVQSIIAGIRWAVDNVGAHIINMSLGFPGGFPVARDLERACNYAVSQGCTIFAAAGNEASSVGQPAIYDSVIAVGAVDKNKTHAQFSNVGPEVDFVAGGVDVYSCYLNDSYCVMSGTCLAEGTYIYGPHGPRKIETVKPGEAVYAYKDGQIVARTVSARLDQGTNTTYHLVSAGRDVWATSTHRFLVLNSKTRAVEWVELCNLTDKHLFLIPRELDSQVNQYLNQVIDIDLAWLLGFFLGDGWLSTTTRSMRFNLATGIEPDVINKAKRIYEARVGKPMKDQKNGGWTYDDCTAMAAAVDTLGMNFKAKDKTIPLWVWMVDRERRTAFYNGYLAADGHEVADAQRFLNPRRTFECASYDLLRRTAILADYNGWQHGHVNSRTRLIKAPNQREARLVESYTLSLGEGNRSPGAGRLNTTRSKHGIRRYVPGEEIARESGIDLDRFYLAPWKLVGSPEVRRVYDLTVPEAENFVAQGLIAHNSMSTPVLSAVAALIIGKHLKSGVKLSPAEVREHLQRISVDVGTIGRDPFFGHGLPIFSNPDWDVVPDVPLKPPQSKVTEKIRFMDWLRNLFRRK